MAVMQTQSLIAEKINLFRRIGELGVKNAALAFGDRLGCDVSVINLNAGMLRVSTLAEQTSNPDNTAIGIHAAVSGEVSGCVAFLLPYKEALTLVDAAMGQPVGTRKRLDELSTSALQEIARIVVSSQLAAISDVSGLDLTNGPITMSADMAYRIVSSVVISAGETDPEAMVVATQFEQSDWRLSALFLFITDFGSLDKLLHSANR